MVAFVDDDHRRFAQPRCFLASKTCPGGPNECYYDRGPIGLAIRWCWLAAPKAHDPQLGVRQALRPPHMAEGIDGLLSQLLGLSHPQNERSLAVASQGGADSSFHRHAGLAGPCRQAEHRSPTILLRREDCGQFAQNLFLVIVQRRQRSWAGDHFLGRQLRPGCAGEAEGEAQGEHELTGLVCAPAGGRTQPGILQFILQRSKCGRAVHVQEERRKLVVRDLLVQDAACSRRQSLPQRGRAADCLQQAKRKVGLGADRGPPSIDLAPVELGEDRLERGREGLPRFDRLQQTAEDSRPWGRLIPSLSERDS